MATKGPTKAAAAGSSVAGGDASMTAKELAALKRQKKREVDRRCQREARQRTKARIAYLEELVDELRQQDTSGQVASLMEQVSVARTERDQFARTLRGIEDAIRGHQSMLDNAHDTIAKHEPDSPDDVLPAVGMVEASAHTLDSISPYDVTMDMDGATYDESTAQFSNSKTLIRNGQFDLNRSMVDSSPSRDAALSPVIPRSSIIPPQTEPCASCEPVESTDPRPQSLWVFANAVLNAPPRLTAREIQWEDQCADDIPVRAAVEGWDAVERRLGGNLPPLWRNLRQIDETVFKRVAPTERLAILRLMHILYRYHADPATQRVSAPPWFLARPSQNIEHAYAIDFFCWPGMRERFVFSEHSYCTDLFWQLLNKSLRILWQFDFRDCYFMDRSINTYRVSPAFDARIADINAWAMGPAFFRQWPELYADIPSWESAALSMDRLGGAGGSGTALANKRRMLVEGHAPLSSTAKKLLEMGTNFAPDGMDNVINGTNGVHANGNGVDGDLDAEADADGVDDDELVNGFGGAEIVARQSAAAAVAAATSPLLQRGMELGPEHDDWLWLQGVDGIRASQLGNMGGQGG